MTDFMAEFDWGAFDVAAGAIAALFVLYGAIKGMVRLGRLGAFTVWRAFKLGGLGQVKVSLPLVNGNLGGQAVKLRAGVLVQGLLDQGARAFDIPCFVGLPDCAEMILCRHACWVNVR